MEYAFKRLEQQFRGTLPGEDMHEVTLDGEFLTYTSKPDPAVMDEILKLRGYTSREQYIEVTRKKRADMAVSKPKTPDNFFAVLEETISALADRSGEDPQTIRQKLVSDITQRATRLSLEKHA